MRKIVKKDDTELAPANASWLDVSAIAQVEVSSEDPAYPIESICAEEEGGWRASNLGSKRSGFL
jgi:hypothetical protein